MPSFNLSQHVDFAKWVQGSVSSGARRGLLSAAFRTLGVIQNELIPAADPQPVDVGAYRAGWRVDDAGAEGIFLTNTLPYASVIEWGARAENIKIGREMIDALAAWVVRKGIASDADARGAAWAIAKSMQQRGIFNRGDQAGLRIGEKALERFRAFVGPEIAREVKRGP